jgi:hypothetical protein
MPEPSLSTHTFKKISRFGIYVSELEAACPPCDLRRQIIETNVGGAEETDKKGLGKN